MDSEHDNWFWKAVRKDMLERERHERNGRRTDAEISDKALKLLPFYEMAVSETLTEEEQKVMYRLTHYRGDLVLNSDRYIEKEIDEMLAYIQYIQDEDVS